MGKNKTQGPKGGAEFHQAPVLFGWYIFVHTYYREAERAQYMIALPKTCQN